MKKLAALVLGVILLIALPVISHAMGLEMAVSAWRQSPQGDISYKKLNISDTVDLERDLRYDDENRIMGRLKLNTPPLIPNIYLMATQMEFDGVGKKTVNFKFGDVQFSADQYFYSKLRLHHYDIALFFGIPLLKTATLKRLNIELGLNARIIDLKAEIQQFYTGLRESKSYTLPIPMVYVAAQITPVKNIVLEAEARGITYSNDHMYDVIGRLKLKTFGPIFISGGYRYEDIDIDEKDVKADVTFKGPFLETGIQF